MKTEYKIFLVLFIFLLSCEKDEIPPEVITVTLNKDALDFLKVTPSKYLIYRDSATSEIDSIIITKCELKNIYHPEHKSNDFFTPDTPAYNGEQFELIYTKKTITNESSNWFKGNAQAEYQFYDSESNIPLNLSDYIDQYIIYNGSFYYDENTIPLASYIVDGITYTNVITHYTDSALEITDPKYLKTEYYWSKGIGIIQKSIERTNGDRKTYYLIRHN